MKKPNLPYPEHVVVGPFTFVIRWEEKTPSDSLGETDFTELAIYIKFRAAVDQQKVTLLHELMHCVHHVTNDRIEDTEHEPKYTEESWVGAITPMLFCVLRDNPEVHEFLFHHR